MTSFIFIGGDRRMLYAAKRLGNFRLCGFQKLTPCTEGYDGDNLSDCAVLPPHKSSDGVNIPCPYSDILVPYSSLGRVLKEGGTVFTGNVCEELEKVCRENKFRLVNYLEREELAVKNAALTAEGAVAIAVNECPFSVLGTPILITGFGRIAKILAEYLTAMGGEVTVACRRLSDRSWAELYGCKTADITDNAEFLTAVSSAAVIFNTVPYGIFGDEEITVMQDNALYIELASVDGICGEIPSGIKYIAARGLPGKVSPATAGELIAETVIAVLSEGGGTGYEN